MYSSDFQVCADILFKIENAHGRNDMIKLLQDYLHTLMTEDYDSVLAVANFTLNRVAPAHENIELGAGEALVIKAVSEVTGLTPTEIRRLKKDCGDLGEVAQLASKFQTGELITVKEVMEKMYEMATTQGKDSQKARIAILGDLLKRCGTKVEARYVARFCLGKMRTGLAELSVVEALGQALYRWETGDSVQKKMKEGAGVVKTAFTLVPDMGKILRAVKNEGGMYNLTKSCESAAGIPMKPMLATPTTGIEDVMSKLKGAVFSCEYKYDGERAQIHYMEGGKIRIFSRNSENNTEKYPDIINRLPQSINEGVKSFILDAEAVAWDVEKKQILPFQKLATRKRKDVKEEEITVQVCVFAFDVLYMNGVSQVNKSFRERRELMRSCFTEVEGQFIFARDMLSNKPEDIQTFMNKAVKEDCEGLMIKTLDVNATYEIAKRSRSWLKLKKDYMEGVCDTLDLVVIGGFNGVGKRTGTYGAFLLACYNPDNQMYESICKIGTGFSDEDLINQHKLLSEVRREGAQENYLVGSTMKPDQWFLPSYVWEVKVADLTVSPVHKAAIGLVSQTEGISLRFPRFERVREDKKGEDATTSAQVAEMYNGQDQIVNAKRRAEGEAEGAPNAKYLKFLKARS